MEMLSSDNALPQIDKLVNQDELEKSRKEYEGLREEFGKLREDEREWRDRLKREEEIRCARFDEEEQSEITVSRNKLVSELDENVRLAKRIRDSMLLGSMNGLAEIEMLKVQNKLKKRWEKCRHLKNEVARLTEDERMSSERAERAEDRYAQVSEELVRIMEERNNVVSELKKKINDQEKQIRDRDHVVGVCQEKLKHADEEIAKTKAEVQDLKGQKLAADQIIEELGKRQVEADRCLDELRSENVESSRIAEKFRLQVLAAKLDMVYTKEGMEDMNCRLSGADQIVDGQCQYSEVSNDVSKLRDQLLAADLEKERYDQVIQEMNQKQLEADQIAKELRRENMEASNVIKDLKNQVLVAAEDKSRSDEIMKEMSQKLLKADRTVEELRCQSAETSNTIEELKNRALTAELDKLRLDEPIEEMRRKLLEADRIASVLRLQNSKLSNVIEELKNQVFVAEMDKVRSDEIIKEMSQKQLKGDQCAEELRRQNSEVSKVVEELKNRLLATEVDNLRSNETILELSKKQLEANKTAEELRSQNMEAANVIKELKDQLLAAQLDKLRSDETIEKMSQKLLEADLLAEELRSQNLKVYNVLEELKNRVLAPELEKLRYDGTIQEVSQKQIKADTEILEALHTIEDLQSKENLEASKVSKAAHFQDSKVDTQELGDGNLQEKATSDAGVLAPAVAEICSTYNASRLQKTDPIDADDSDDGAICGQCANNLDSFTKTGQQAKILLLPSQSQSVLAISCTPRRKRDPLEREDDNSTNCRQTIKRIRIPTQEAHAVSGDDNPGSPSSGFKGMGNNQVLENWQNKASTPYASLSGNLNSSDDEDCSTDSEDESCSDSCINTIIANLRSKKLRKEWKSASDMLNDFQQDVEHCMNSVCVLYRQKVSNSESSIDSHRRLAHFDAIGGPDMAKYLINGDPENILKKYVAEVKQERPDILDGCRRLAMDYNEELFSIYCTGKDAFFKPA